MIGEHARKCDLTYACTCMYYIHVCTYVHMYVNNTVSAYVPYNDMRMHAHCVSVSILHSKSVSMLDMHCISLPITIIYSTKFSSFTMNNIKIYIHRYICRYYHNK